MTGIYDKIIETQSYIQSTEASSEEYDKYINNLTKVTLEQSINDKYHYSRILIMKILNKSRKKEKLPIKSFDATLLKNEEQILPASLNYDNLTTTINTLKEQKTYFANLIDIIAFNLIPSLFFMFSEENSFDIFIEFIMGLSSNEDDFDFQLLMSRSIFVSPSFLQFTYNVFYPIFKPPDHDLISLYNISLSDNYIPKFQKRIIDSIKANISTCPITIIKFLKTLKAKSKQTAVTILRKCIFDPIIANPSLFLTNDIWCSDYQDENNKISSILKESLTDDLINQIDEIMESNNSYFDPFYNKKGIEIGCNFIIYHKLIDMIDILSINQIQSILEGNKPSTDIIESIYNSNFEEFSLFSSHFEGEINPWICIKKILKNSAPFKQNLNNNEDNNQINLSYFLQILENNLGKNNSSRILFNQIKSIFQKNQELFTQEELEKQLDLMKENNDVKERVTNEDIIELKKKLSIIPSMKQYAVNAIEELFFTFLTRKIGSEEIEFPTNIHQIIRNTAELTRQFENYLSNCNEKAKEISGKYNFNNIFYHRYWHNLHFKEYLNYRLDLFKYDTILSDFLSKNYLALVRSYIHPTNANNKILKSVAFALKNTSLFHSKMSQVIQIFENNDDPLSKYVKFERIFNSYLQQIRKLTNKSKLEYDDIFGLEELFLGIINPPHFISNIIYMNEFLNYVNYPNSFLGIRLPIHFLIKFIEVRINELIQGFHFPIYYLSRNHVRHITIYITGNDTSLIAMAYKSAMRLVNNEKAPQTEEDLNELALGIDKNKIPDRFILVPELEYIYMCVVNKITFKVTKQLKEKDIQEYNNENKLFYTNYGIFASSCSEYRNESPEQKFLNCKKLDVKFIVFKEGADVTPLHKLRITNVNTSFVQSHELFGKLDYCLQNYI